jgi:hypothetical protein
MNERPSWSATDRAWHLATHNFQLLAMLEVLKHHTVADLADLAAAVRLTMAFPAQLSPAECAYPIDPGGRVRAMLTQAQARAFQIPTAVCEMIELADACRSLSDWIAMHDRPFEDRGSGAPVAIAAS